MKQLQQRKFYNLTEQVNKMKNYYLAMFDVNDTRWAKIYNVSNVVFNNTKLDPVSDHAAKNVIKGIRNDFDCTELASDDDDDDDDDKYDNNLYEEPDKQFS